MFSFNAPVLVAMFSLGILGYLYFKPRRSDLPLPPGPRKLPLLGNLLDVPVNSEWETYHKWSEEFDSDIIHLDIAGTSVVILDTDEVAMDLLERRSSIYSSRPRFPMLNELSGYNFHFAFMEYGDEWREHRRIFHQSFYPAAVKRFRPRILKNTHTFLRYVLNKPDVDICKRLHHLAGANILDIVYGLDVLPENDPYILASEEGMQAIRVAGVPGAFLVDAFPILAHLPGWISFQRLAKKWRKIALTMISISFDGAMEKIQAGGSVPSLVSESMECADDIQNPQHREAVIKSTAGTAYIAATDTTVSSISSAILALLANPAILKKAQQEIDSVVAPGQLPDFDDHDSLPYVAAIVKEALRWREVTPIGAPHLLIVDDEYKGYKLPAGSIVISNVWAMLHKESTYPDPFTFNPERFLKDGQLDPSVKDPAHAAFGFGRRICPGRHMAYDAIWIAIASMIAAFDITKPVDADGNIVEPTYEYLLGLVCLPVHFKSVIKPRSMDKEASIRATATHEY
ncbi:hypothetical protein Hypma_000390 [Hypsizygus marmoreus]|uniref:O-methylsterigmatocystin oxidoreductase n=1 Tax=Hypsizygus marmoreus TaxID=39966 RepID=A0A369JG73_HYPMA|nr:hypothetical protein Hypma_000390 [Hypsizygus marmoreus]